MTDEQALEILQKTKEFLDPFLIGKEDFIPVIPDIYEALKGRPDLSMIGLYDGKYNYSVEGKKEAHGERIDYSPITVDIQPPSTGWWFVRYRNGNYDIDDDIACLIKCMNEPEPDGTQWIIRFYDYEGGVVDDEEFYGTEDEALEYAESIMEDDETYELYAR